MHRFVLRSLAIACLGLPLALAEEPVAPPLTAPPAADPVNLTSAEVTEQAGGMVISGRRAEAIALLEDHLHRNPDDAAAMQMLLAVRIGELEEEIRAILARDAATRELAAAPKLDYAAIKAKADEVVQRRLEVADYFDARGKPGEAIEACDTILKDHTGHPAVLAKKLDLLKQLRAKLLAERRGLEAEADVRAIAAINEVIEKAIMPQEKMREPRTVMIFDEDVAEADRSRVRARLRERVSLENMVGVEVRKVIENLFAIAGINYVILDSAIGTETLTINVVDESLENILAIISRQVQLRYNYIAGTVYISSAASTVLETEIIRLQSGLTDVMAKIQLQSGSQAGGQNGGSAVPDPFAQAQPQEGEASSDLEKFVAKIPDIIVGWPAEGTIYLDRKSNSVFVRSTPAGIAEVKRLLQAIDYNSAQVLIEARFVLVGESAGFQLGLDWAGRTQSMSGGSLIGAEGGTNFGGGAAPAPLGSPTNPAGLAPGITVSGILGDLNGEFLGATLRALESKGKVSSLAEPKILTLNNATGVLALENDIAYIESYQTESQSTSGTPTNNGNVVTTQSVVLRPQLATEKEEISLKVVPSVARNSDVITLRLMPRVRQLTSTKLVPFQYQPSAGAGLITVQVEKPQFDDRKLETVLHVKNGQTVALGGLVSQVDEQSTRGLPWISRIPLLGRLFRNDSNNLERRNLVIFVTAYLIETNGAKVSDDVRMLRDNARVALPAAVREEVMRRAQEESDGGGATGTPGWQRGRGK